MFLAAKSEVKAWLCMAMMVVGVPLTLQIENHLLLGYQMLATTRDSWGKGIEMK